MAKMIVALGFIFKKQWGMGIGKREEKEQEKGKEERRGGVREKNRQKNEKGS